MCRTGWGATTFFLLQPVGMALEVGAGVLARKVGVRGPAMAERVRRAMVWDVIGYAWTAAWLLGTSPWFFDELVQVRTAG